jgi:biotin carboxyl carrier protein
MKIFASIEDKVWTFEQIESNGAGMLQDKSHQAKYTFTALGNNRFVFILNGTSHLIHIIKENGLFHVHLDGDYFSVRVEDERTRELRALVEQAAQTSGQQVLIAPIPGFISKIKVKEGDTIKQGEGLIILEAMKMENEIKAEHNGTIEKIMIKEGTPVEKDQELLIIS